MHGNDWYVILESVHRGGFQMVGNQVDLSEGQDEVINIVRRGRAEGNDGQASYCLGTIAM